VCQRLEEKQGCVLYDVSRVNHLFHSSFYFSRTIRSSQRQLLKVRTPPPTRVPFEMFTTYNTRIFTFTRKYKQNTHNIVPISRRVARVEQIFILHLFCHANPAKMWPDSWNCVCPWCEYTVNGYLPCKIF